MSTSKLGNVTRRLKKIGLVPIEKKYEQHSASAIEEFENELGQSLPIAYQEFLMKYGKSTFAKSAYFRPVVVSPKTNDDGLEGEVSFFGLSELKTNVVTFGHRLRKCMLPIADAPGGDLICIDLLSGQVFRWDHDTESVADSLTSAYHLVAQSFIDFLESFEGVEENDDDTNIDDLIESVTINDKFIRKQ